MAKKEMQNWIVCGRAIGKCSGWDQSDTFSMMLYDFDPRAGYDGPRGDVLFRFENGTIESFNNDGSVKLSCDMIDAIKNLPVERTDN
jgi:hypothetical protein